MTRQILLLRQQIHLEIPDSSSCTLWQSWRFQKSRFPGVYGQTCRKLTGDDLVTLAVAMRNLTVHSTDWVPNTRAVPGLALAIRRSSGKNKNGTQSFELSLVKAVPSQFTDGSHLPHRKSSSVNTLAHSVPFSVEP